MVQHRSTIGFAVIGLAVACTNSAGFGSVIVNLSMHSSDDTDPAQLDATFEFSVFDDVLSLTVTNLTVAPADYRINEVYFNAPDTVEVLSMTDGPSGWNLQADTFGAGKFGLFSFGLIGGVGNSPSLIDAGDSATWSIEITGTTDAASFANTLSTTPPGDTPSIIAAKFVQGPAGDSSFGATSLIPGPVAAMVLLSVFYRSRRRNELSSSPPRCSCRTAFNHLDVRAADISPDTSRITCSDGC